MASLPAALAVLHAGPPSGTDHVESSHDPDRCRVLHDHELCLVFGANPPTPSRPAAHTGAPSLPARDGIAAGARRPPAAGETSTRRPRAPPLPA